MKSDECIICGKPLVYLEHPEEMECAVCHAKFISNARCEQGHYVCDNCHTTGIDSIIGISMSTTSRNPIEILEQMMSLPTCHMHGPEHHIMVGSALLAAYRNAGGETDMEWALSEMVRRGRQVPGGACGNWGACGAAISTGMFVSIITKGNPLATEAWSMSNMMTSRALAEVAKHGGPRCCKRDSYLSVMAAVAFVAERLAITMELPKQHLCSRSRMNNQCIGSRCPFSQRVYTIG